MIIYDEWQWIEMIGTDDDDDDDITPHYHSSSITRMSTEEEPCAPKRLASKEKNLCKEIYELECKEQSYLQKIGNADVTKVTSKCDSKCPEVPDEKRGCAIKERISFLETCGKNLCENLRILQKNRECLTKKAEDLTCDLDKTRESLGLVGGKFSCANGSRMHNVGFTEMTDDECSCGQPAKVSVSSFYGFWHLLRGFNWVYSLLASWL